MRRVRTIRHEFVASVPSTMQPRTLYISIEHGTCIHQCLCGCGSEVVTPLTPRHWALTYDGETVSLWPSIGSWSLPCQSHYVIRRSRVRWVPPVTAAKVGRLRQRDRPARLP